MARQEVALRDVDGDGYPDHVASVEDGGMTVARNRTGRTNLLKSIARPLGATIDRYRLARKWFPSCLRAIATEELPGNCALFRPPCNSVHAVVHLRVAR